MEAKNKRLVLVDGFAVLHRAYHALPPLTNSKGEMLNAVYGFCTMLFKVTSDLAPNYLAVVFDTPKPTFRLQPLAIRIASRSANGSWPSAILSAWIAR